MLTVAHCLELGIVAASPSKEEVEKDIISIIKEQVRYCIVNDNMENLFRNAPEEVWEEFRACKKRTKPHQQEFEAQKGPIPISFVTNNCCSPLDACCV